MIGVVKHVHNNACKVEWINFSQSQLNEMTIDKEGYIKELKLNILVPEDYVAEKKRMVNIFCCYFIFLLLMLSF